MKKNFRFALMSAIALVGAATFTACSSSDDVADVNPTYDGTSVRTDFAFNITKASQSQTRMTATNVQEPTGFRGMQDMYLFAMQGVPGEDGTTRHQTYALQTLAANLLDDDDATTTPSSKVYPLTIPVGTDNFLFYARALRNSETNFQVGKVGFNNLETTTTTTDISFNLAPIEKPSSVTAARSVTEEKFVTYLNNIAGAQYNVENTWAGTVTKAETDSRYSGIAKLYTDFAKPVDGEVRSGSSESIMRTIRDLYTSMKGIIELSNGTDEVSVAINGIADAVCTEIESSSSPIFTLTAPTGGLYNQSDPYTIAWAGGINEWEKNFPASYDLPMGAAQLVWDSTNKKIKYNTNFDYSPQTATSSTLGVDVTKIAYPAEILYYDNSPLRATDEYKTVAQYPTTTTLWDAEPGSKTGAFDGTWLGTSVQPSTRAVAMKNNVNYGVALLESTVKLNPSVTTTLNDNRNAIVAGSGNQSFPVSGLTEGKGFQLTGILIGGQPGSVNWKLLPSNASFDYAIYDKDLDGTGNWVINATTSELTKLYTVCFDNFVSGGGAQKEVCIALEFKNNMGVDFYGAKNMIPAGNTFYLVGKLQVTASSSSPGTWKSDYPTGYRVSESATPRVFGQDHKTVVTFNLNENSLKAAYSTIPDLRSTEMLFGLSVDLHWKSGLTFDIDLQ